MEDPKTEPINLNSVSLETIKALPKVELHAHLTASFPRESFVELLQKKGLDTDISYLDS
jgi:adenosine deaminase